ncbi:hypothetical protein QBC39DRAFT_363900 [Podospora conica]|nr:hypothetical protein QBC39DRAFT_363900 [Schizothecium conicum]
MLVRMSAQLETATEQLVILGTNGAVPVNIRLFEETWDDLYCTLSGKSCAAGSDEGYSELHQQALELVSTLEDLFEKQLTAIREELQSLNDVFLGLETWVKGFSVKAARRCWSVLGYDLWCGSDRRNVGDAYFAYGRLLTDLAQLINDSRERRGLAIKDMRTTTILQRGLLRVLSLDKSLSPATIYYLARSASEMTAEAMQNQKDAEAGASNRWFLLRLWSWVTSSSPRQRTQTESPDALQAVDPTDSLEAIASEAVIAGYLYDGIGIKLRWKAADFEKENSSLSALSQNVKSDVDWYWQTKNPASFSQIQDRFAGLVHWYNEFWGILILHNIEFTEQWNRELRED